MTEDVNTYLELVTLFMLGSIEVVFDGCIIICQVVSLFEWAFNYLSSYILTL